MFVPSSSELRMCRRISDPGVGPYIPRVRLDLDVPPRVGRGGSSTNGIGTGKTLDCKGLPWYGIELCCKFARGCTPAKPCSRVGGILVTIDMSPCTHV